MTGLVFGYSGQVATELRRLSPNLTYFDRKQANLEDPSVCGEVIRIRQPNFVINAAAYTAVDAAESDREKVLEVNGNAPGAMARAAAELNIPLVHISTDYVFNGSGDQAWRPEDEVDPINYYGASKAEGEAQIIASGAEYAILRTSWVFSAHGANFVKTMLRLADSRDHLDIVSDQIGGPTPANRIAEACLTIAKALAENRGQKGIYHFAGAPVTNWAAFARVIFERSGKRVTVSDILSEAYPTAAQRPLNSRLDCSKIMHVFGIEQPDWESELISVLAELKGTS